MVSPFKKKTILIIALAADYPTKEKSTAGPFIKEFFKHLSSIYDCRVMLVEREFIAIRHLLKWFWNTIERWLNWIFPKKEIRGYRNNGQDKERVLHVKYPVVTVSGVPLHVFDGISAVWKARKALKGNEFKIDIIQTFKSFPPAYIGWKIKKNFGVPVVNMEYQGPFSSYADEPYRMKRVLAAIGNIDRTVYTKFQIDVIRSYGIPDGKLGHGHFGVDTERFVFDKGKYLKRKKESLENRVKLLIIGRVEEEKGLKDLIEAMSILAGDFPKVQLSIVGSKGDCFEWVMNRIKVLGIEENVRYLGFVEERYLPGIISDHDILIIASLLETLGMTMLEALSCGKPVVATKCGGPEEVINEHTGVLVPVRDSSALAHGIKKVIERYDSYDPDLIRGYVLNNFSYTMIGKRFRNLYEELVQKKDKSCVESPV